MIVLVLLAVAAVNLLTAVGRILSGSRRPCSSRSRCSRPCAWPSGGMSHTLAVFSVFAGLTVLVVASSPC